jgi:uncharacterized iron-regulated membrane protein
VHFFEQFLRRPQQLFIRRVNFQVHLWAGVILAIYVSLIGITGSVLVFGAELDKSANPVPWPALAANQQIADLALVIDSLKHSYPHTHIVSVMAPTPSEPVIIAILQTPMRITVACNPITGQVIGEAPARTSRIEWIYDLHENLLARRAGRVANGVGAALLLLLAGTGLLNWWQGVQRWRLGLKIDFQRRWRRITFDFHRAVGFWSLGFLLLWAATAIYFTWPAKVLTAVDRLSPIVNSRPPAVTVDPDSEVAALDFHAMLERAYAADPGATWKGIVFPASRRSPFEMLLSRAPGIGRDYEDTVYFNPYNGRYISIWRYGVNKSLGDWIIWLQIPLHFGTHWGLAVKCLWSAIGLSLPLLSISGLVMYWNRVLSKQWNRLREVRALS